MGTIFFRSMLLWLGACVILSARIADSSSFHVFQSADISDGPALQERKTPLTPVHSQSAFRSTPEKAARLYISMESVLSVLKKKQEMVLADLRAQVAFEKLRIPGSIRIPLYALKTKPFLKDKALVLIAEGHPDSALEQACRDLREKGFKRVFILSGGLNYWKEKEGPLEGDIFSLQEVSKVSPGAFYRERHSMEWLVIDLSKPGAEPIIPRAVRLHFAGDREAFISKLKKTIEENPGPSSRALLLCDENGQSYGGVEQIIHKGKIKRVFYLAGGMEGYRVFLDQREEASCSEQEATRKCPACP